ncbi:hypothetical protein [Paenibacillus hexagrammi]|uniref:Uncharacterized protein n=1 Tax=Paenibacillus hexagrammi TaxID=2908839 RepID=A0ABY3SN08_9BACL|nr:hypothetical protein [Paenibacillus sp. YPD9-1]UJF35422.1 hypothetical protein L0M14_10145 [Paenibacillus sp. YPD9-1]
MPFILQNMKNKQVYACMLVNHYELAYYGVKYWDTRDDALEQSQQFLQERGEALPIEWEVKEIEDRKMKLCNVKLKNDPTLDLFEMDYETYEARRRE